LAIADPPPNGPGNHSSEDPGKGPKTDPEGNGGPATKTPATCYIMAQVHDGQFARVDDPPDGFRCDAPYFELPH